MLTDEELEYLDSREATLEAYRQLRALYLQFLRDTKDPNITAIEPLTTEEFAIYFSHVAQCPPPEFPPKETTSPANIVPFPLASPRAAPPAMMRQTQSRRFEMPKK